MPDFEIDAQSQADKPQLRRLLLQRRRERARNRKTEREALAGFALELVQRFQARTIATYEPMPSEPDISGLLSKRSPGNPTVKPAKIRSEAPEFLIPHLERIDGKLAAPQWKSTHDPKTVLPLEELQRADLVFIPALAVDESGTRLGRGGGWYDRALQVFRETSPEVRQSVTLQAATEAVTTSPADTVEPAFARGVAAKARQLTRVPVIAVVFANEVFPAGFLPREPHDFPVRGVLTEAGYREFS